MNMIEKIAVGQSEFDGRPWLSMPKTERDRYIARARLAIEAMREPTEAMVDAAADEWVEDWRQRRETIRAIWTAAINAALK